MSTFFSLFPIIFLIMGLAFMGLGLLVIIPKKPLIIPSRFTFYLILVSWAPMLLNLQPLFAPNARYARSSFELMMPWAIVAMYSVLGLFMWMLMQGYTAYGVTDTSFRDGLVKSLEKLEIPFEENLSGIYLSSLGANLQVPIQSWMGSAQLNIRPRKLSPVLKTIVKEMNHYYKITSVSINYTVAYFNLIMGLFMLMFAFYFQGVATQLSERSTTGF